jgi:glycosyltransferase involved in cell wall biosynthesis
MTVSVVIPVYKVEDYIIRCIDSVFSQTYRKLEVILVDDCSPDNSMQKARNYIESIPDNDDLTFIYLRHENNRGISAARNTGVDVATGSYIYFLDSDDEILPDSIETLVSLSDNGKIDYIRGSHLLLTEEKIVFQECVLQDMIVFNNSDIIQKYTSHKLHVTPWNSLVKKEFCRKIRFKEGVIHEDVLWTFVIMNQIKTLASTSHVTYYNYGRPGSIINSLTDRRCNDNMMIIFREMDRLYQKGIIKKEKENKKYIIERKGERLYKILKSDQLDKKLRLEYAKQIVGMRDGISVLAYFSFLYLYDRVYIRIKNVLKH